MKDPNRVLVELLVRLVLKAKMPQNKVALLDIYALIYLLTPEELLEKAAAGDLDMLDGTTGYNPPKDNYSIALQLQGEDITDSEASKYTQLYTTRLMTLSDDLGVTGTALMH